MKSKSSTPTATSIAPIPSGAGWANSSPAGVPTANVSASPSRMKKSRPTAPRDFTRMTSKHPVAPISAGRTCSTACKSEGRPGGSGHPARNRRFSKESTFLLCFHGRKFDGYLSGGGGQDGAESVAAIAVLGGAAGRRGGVVAVGRPTDVRAAHPR